MKKETKELIEYMYDKFADRIAITRSLSPEQRKSAEAYNTQRDKIQKFLKSLPEIEEKLCFGGYIQDKNGVPCCQGDKIYAPFQDIIGTLKWDLPNRRFVVVTDNGTEWSLSSWEFEKVE
jgi:hypothetical protein